MQLRYRVVTVAGSFDHGDGHDRQRDVLLVGSSSDIQAYDVEDNRDLFVQDVQDGVSALCVGHIGAQGQKLAVAGGNCTIQVNGHIARGLVTPTLVLAEGTLVLTMTRRWCVVGTHMLKHIDII